MAVTINADNGVSSGSAGLKQTADSTGVLALQTNGTTALTVDTSQNVGIGTSSPGYKLDVTQNTASDANVQIYNANSGVVAANFRMNALNTTGSYYNSLIAQTAGTENWRIGGNGSANTIAFMNGSGATERMRIDSSGNVGIGASPVTNLTISSASAATGGDGLQYVHAVYTGTGTVNAGYTAKNYYGTSQLFQWENNGTRFGNRVITNGGGGNLIFTYGNDTEGMRLTSAGLLQFNSGYGSTATAYGCRAWVNFNGTTASPSTIRGSGNVTSITKNATGNYTLNFTNAMPDANYSAVGSAGRANDGNNYVGFDTNTYSTTQVKFFTLAAGSAPSNTDMTGVYISIFR